MYGDVSDVWWIYGGYMQIYGEYMGDILGRHVDIWGHKGIEGNIWEGVDSQ